MAGASREQTGRCDFVSTVPPVRPAATTCFKWSLAIIRKASFVLLFAAMPPIAGFALSNSSVKWLCLAWLAGIALLMHGRSRRARDDAVVLSVDRQGIHDCRFARRHILWSEIDAVCATDMGWGHAVDVYLRCPDGDFYVITISMQWLDGNVSEMMRAVAEWRPDLVNGAARRALSLEPSGPWF